MKEYSELRQDPVSGDWIVIAPGRAKRARDLILKKSVKRKRAAKSGCPFEDLEESGNKPIITYPNKKKWAVAVIENKYPAVMHSDRCHGISRQGPFSTTPTVGHHDVIITEEHDENFPALSRERANLVFQSFRDRYLMLHSDECLAYISIFHNWGPKAGASVYHPHYQLIAIPVVPPDVQHSLNGSARYFEENKKCVHDVMIEWEKKQKIRIVYENEGAIAFTPFVSRNPFEVRIFPKKHLPFFENTYDQDMASVVDALQNVLKKIQKNLKDPDYNFFIHTAPIKDKDKYGHYHWHIEIIPKITIQAGFELGTGVEINVVAPDEAARILSR